MNKSGFSLIKPRSIFLLAAVACLSFLAVSSATVTPTPLVITTTQTDLNLHPATTGQSFSFPFSVSGGTPPYKWAAATNTPTTNSINDTGNGFTLTPGGVFAGIPIYSGIFPIIIEVTDATGLTSTVQFDFTVNGPGSPQAISNSPPNGTQGVPYDFTFASPWGQFCFLEPKLIEGNIPTGLGLNSLTGRLSGVPLLAGTYTFTLSASTSVSSCASLPRATNVKAYTITIAPSTSPPTPPGGSGYVRQNSGNPVLAPSSPSAWDDFMIRSPSVIKVGGNFLMYYEGEDSATHTRRIGLATSSDGITWTKEPSNPVLDPGAPGAFDASGVLLPSVHFDGATYRMWYTAGCGRIGLATSPDGVAWTKRTTPLALGSCDFGREYVPGPVIQTGGNFVMWYWHALGSIGRATSPDGIAWTDNGWVTFDPSFDSGVELHRPSVVLEGSTYRMWMSKTNGFVLVGPTAGFDLFKSNIGYATSSDGLHWTLVQDEDGNGFATMFVQGPANAWDRPGVGEPSVIKDGDGTYRMWYTGGRINEPPYGTVSGSIGYATAAGSPAPPTLSVSPAGPVAYGTVPVGATADRTFLVQNNGGGTLTGSVSISAPFSIFSGDTFSLTAGQSQAVVVRFTPSGAGAVTGTVNFTSNGGSASPGVTGTGSTAPPATISSFSPTSAVVGTVVTITGTNFTNVQSVKFNNNVTATFTVASATSIKANVPAGAVMGQISVTTLSGTATSAVALPFKVLPKITSFTPTSGTVMPPTQVTITGSGFTGATSVKFGAVALAPVTGFTVNSDSQITVTSVPALAVTAALSVITPAGTAVSATTFTVIKPPTITSFTPLTGATVGAVVTITGTNLTGTTQVNFTGASVAPTTVTATSLTVAVPAGAVTGTITVTNAALPSAPSAVFKVLPKITGFTPTSGIVGAPITINGFNFTGATSVKFGTVTLAPLTGFTVNSDGTQITATVPTPATPTATTGAISVTVGTATATSAGAFTTILGPAITSFTPASAAVGTVITITGTNLTGTDQVSFIGASNAPTTVTATSITVTVPAGATTGKIKVHNPFGDSALSSGTLTLLPKITGFTPTSGVIGATVTINGFNFTGATAVKFGTILATSPTVLATQITVNVPTGAISAKISVTTPSGTATSATNFVVIKAPTITSFTPATGAIETLVTISGTNLDGITEVKFNGVSAGPPTQIVSAASIKATVPAGATTGKITVTNGINPPVLSVANFTVLPKITSFTPTTGQPGDSVTISGSGFTGTTAVKFGTGGASSFSVDSDQQITVTVPAGAVTGKISVTKPGGTSISVASFTVTLLKPDLAVTTVTAPATASSGQSISVTNAVQNQGNAAAGAFTVGLYLSTDNTIDPSVDRLLTSRPVASLAAAAISSVATTVVIPADVGTGTYFLGAVADTGGTVTEFDETNNTKASSAVTITLFRTLTITKTGTGTVTGSPVGINCGATCSKTYADGTPVTLTPTAAAGFTFAGWSGDCTGTGTCNVSMNGPRTVLVTFAASGVGTSVALTGTAAKGNPITGKQVSLKDRNGNAPVSTPTTDSVNGQYSFTSANLTGRSLPFLLRVEYQTNVFLYSVATQLGVVNINPYTDLIIRTWYGAQGISINEVFDGGVPIAQNPPPTAVELGIFTNAVEDFLAPWLKDNNLSPATFDLFTTPFTVPTASAPFDAVLDATVVTTDGQSTIFTLKKPPLIGSQRTQIVTVTPTADSFTVNIQTCAGLCNDVDTQKSFSSTTFIVPASPAIRSALNGILLTLSNFGNVIKTKGAVLASTDILPFFDTNYLDRGYDRALGAANLATELRGAVINSFKVDRILAYDETTQVITIIGTASITRSGVTVQEIIDEDGRGFSLKQGTDGVWRMFGDQRIAQVRVDASTENRFTGITCESGCDGVVKTLQLQANALENALTGASVTGSDGISEPLVKGDFVNVDTIKPTPTTTLDIRKEQFNRPEDNTNGGEGNQFPPAGTIYTFTVNPAVGDPKSYNVTLGATTDEAITMPDPALAVASRSPTAHTLAAAKLGQALAVNWTLPTTFAIRDVRLNGFVAVGDVGCDVQGTVNPTTLKSGTITLPTTCAGQSIVARTANSQGSYPAQIQVTVRGMHGEETRAWWAFGSTGTGADVVLPKLIVTKVGTGTVTGNGALPIINCGTVCTRIYNGGEPITLTATPAAGFVFSGWSGACDGTGTCNVAMDDHKFVTATFTPLFALTVTRSGIGSVTSSPAGINCPSACSASFLSGTVVTLTPAPTGGSAFTGWSGSCTGSGACTVTMSAAKPVTAAFTTPPALTVTRAGLGSGSVISSPSGISCGADCTQTFASGSFVTLTATPSLGSAFTGWSGACTGTGGCSVSLTAAKTVTATFALIPGVTPPAGSFGAADLTGTWNLYSLVEPETRGQTGAWVTGALTISATGAVSGSETVGTTATPLTFTLSGGPLTITANGAVTGNFSNSAGAAKTFIATMLPTKDQIIGVVTVRDSKGAVLRTGLTFLVKKTTATTFSMSDLDGAWRSYALTIGSATGVGSWGYGSSTISSGVIQSGASFTRPDGQTIPLTGSYAVASNGAVTGTVTNSAINNIIPALTRTVIASMAPSKNRIVGVQTIKDVNQSIVSMGLVNLVKDTGSGLAASDLAGAWRFYALATPSAANEGGGWGAGTFTIDNTAGLTSGQFITSGDGEPIVLNPGSFTLGSNGVFSGSLTAENGMAVAIPDALLFPSKDGVLGVSTIEQTEEGETRKNFVLFGMVKDNPALPPSLTVAKVGTGSGTVTGSLTGINCGADCAESYPKGTPVTLTAVPAAGSTFVGWSGAGCEGTGTCTVTLNSSALVSAAFTAPTFNFQLVFSYLQGCFDGAMQGPNTIQGAFGGPCGLSFPSSLGYYFANFNVNDDPNFPASVTFSGPAGSMLSNTPQEGIFFHGDGSGAGYGSKSVCFFGATNGPQDCPFLPQVPNSPPGGNYIVNYKGQNLTFALAAPSAANFPTGHALVAVPAAIVDGSNHLTRLDWQYFAPALSQGSSVPPPAFIAETEVRVQGFLNGQDSSLYNARGLPPTTTSHVLGVGATVNWLDVTQVQIVYTDNLGNQYTSYWQRANVPAPTINPPLSPTSGPVGTSVTITGTNFGVAGQSGAAKAVRFNGVLASFTIDLTTQITATVPDGAISGLVTVENIGGVSNQVSFTVTTAGGGLTVTTVGTGTGTVSSAPAGINCPGTCSFTYPVGTQVTLTATPTGGAAFTGWTGACANTTGTCTVTMDVAKSVTAIFTVPTFNLTVTKGGNGVGTVTSSPSAINCGTICAAGFNSGAVTLTAAPFPSSTFGGWSGCDSVAIVSGLSTCTVNMNGAKSVTAGFAAITIGAAPNVTLISNDAALTEPGAITTDGVNLYVGNSGGPASIFSVPIGGGADKALNATNLYPNVTACCVVGLTVLSGHLYWIDPNGGPITDTTIGRAPIPPTSGSIERIYTGANVGQPIVDGEGITTDGGSKLYTSDAVQGRVHSLNWNGSGITQLGSRYGGFFNLEHNTSITQSGGVLYISDEGCSCPGGTLPPKVMSIPVGGGPFTTLYDGATNPVLIRPHGIAAGNDGFLYITDSQNNTIWKLKISDGTLTVLASGAPFVQVNYIVYDSGTDALYVTDSGNVGSSDGLGAIRKVAFGSSAPSFALSVTISGAGAGTVTSNPGGIACSSNPCNANFTGGNVTLTATAGTGSTFTGWSGNCTGMSCTVNMGAGHSVTATFDVAAAPGSPAFVQADLAATWRVYSMTTTEIPGQAGGWVTGTVTIDNTGAVTAGSLTPFGGSVLPVTGGTFTMSAQGILNGTVSTGSGPTATTRVINGTMSATKDQMVTVFTLRNDTTGLELRNGLTMLVKQTNSTFVQTDLSGLWRSYALVTSTATGVGSWGFANPTTDNSGNITGGSITRSDGTVIPLTGGTRTVSSDGIVTGTVTSAGLTRTVNASMLPSKQQVVGVETITDANNVVLSVGLFSLVKDAAGFVSGDVVGTWRLYGLDTPGASGNGGGWGAGTITIGSDGSVSGRLVTSGGEGSLIDFTSGSGSVDSHGVFTGTLNTSDGQAISVIAGLVPSKDWFAGVFTITEEGKSPNAGALVLVKEDPAGLPTLSVVKQGPGTGAVTAGNPAEINCGADCAEAYQSGTSVTLTAAPAAGTTFAGWLGCDSTSNNGLSCTVAVTATKYIAASFGPQVSLHFLHFANAGNFGAGVTPAVTFPVILNSYAAGLDVRLDSNFPDASTILVTGPNGSGLTNAPANFFSSVQETKAFYEAGLVTNPTVEPAGDWTVTYRGVAHTIAVPDPQVPAHLVIPVPTANVVNGVLQSVSWVYKDAFGNTLGTAPSFMTSIQVQVFDQCTAIYDSPSRLSPSATSHQLTSTVQWGIVGRIFMAYNDQLGNHYVIGFDRGSAQCAQPTITGFTPSSGPIGATVTITGTNFASNANVTAVKFSSDKNANFTINSSTSITATVPSGAGFGPISVTTQSGTATSANSFTITP